jgi:hypothetical protein
MAMFWFIPLAISVGILGTLTAWDMRHLGGRPRHNKSWLLLFIIGWAPTICWMLAQVVQQD